MGPFLRWLFWNPTERIAGPAGCQAEGLERGSNAPACTGRFPEPTRSPPCVAAASVVASRTSGNVDPNSRRLPNAKSHHFPDMHPNGVGPGESGAELGVTLNLGAFGTAY